MHHRLVSFSLITLWGLLAPAAVWSADSAQLLAQLEDYDIIAVNQAQLRGFGTAPLEPTPSAAADAEAVYSKQLLGLYIDDVEQPAVTAVYDGQEYLLPLVTIMDGAGVTISTNSQNTDPQEIGLSTPGGGATLDPQDLRLVEGQVMVRQSALAEKLFMDVRFDQASLALYLRLPWTLSQSSSLAAGIIPEAQFSPPSVSLRNLRADLGYFRYGEEEGVSGDYFAAGNLARGTWRVRAEQDSSGTITPRDYYWSRQFGNSQALLGNSDYSLHPLLPFVEQTGLQLFYSSAPLPRFNSGADITRANSRKGIANGIRDIAGIAAPGAVAELRVDGSVVARNRVRLDGSYDFPNIELPTRGYSEVQVLILDSGSGTLLDTQDFSRRSGIELLGAGQHSVFAAFGDQGNPLDDRVLSMGTTGAAQWRYGLTEDLTVELGRQQVGDFNSNEASMSLAFSKQWFGSLGYAQSFDRDGLQLDLEGGNNLWRFDLTAREYDIKGPESNGLLGNQSDQGSGRKEWLRYMSYRYQLTDSLVVGLVGRDSGSDYESDRFVLPSISWNNYSNLSFSAFPNTNGSYRVDSRYRLNLQDTARYTYEGDRHLVDFRRNNGKGREYYFNYRVEEEYKDRAELGLAHYSDSQWMGQTRLGLVSNGGDLGYTVDWESKLLPGINSRLRLAKGGYDQGLLEEDNELYLQWQMTLDFAVAKNRIVSADSTRGSLESAALTGEVLVGAERITSRYGVDRIELLVNGVSRTALVQGGRYYVDGLEPGLHKISVDSRFLPIELMPGANQTYWVRLEAAAATEVPLVLEARFAIAGRVQNVAGENMIGEQLNILNSSGRKVGEAYTDQYGLYRADNLAPGNYYVIVERDGERVAAIEISITDSFLFEQDIVVP